MQKMDGESTKIKQQDIDILGPGNRIRKMVMEDSKLLQLFIKEISLEIKKMDLEY